MISLTATGWELLSNLFLWVLDGQLMARYHEVNADQDRVPDSAEDSIGSGRFTKKSKPVHCSIWSTETV